MQGTHLHFFSAYESVPAIRAVHYASFLVFVVAGHTRDLPRPRAIALASLRLIERRSEVAVVVIHSVGVKDL